MRSQSRIYVIKDKYSLVCGPSRGAIIPLAVNLLLWGSVGHAFIIIVKKIKYQNNFNKLLSETNNEFLQNFEKGNYIISLQIIDIILLLLTLYYALRTQFTDPGILNPSEK